MKEEDPPASLIDAIIIVATTMYIKIAPTVTKILANLLIFYFPDSCRAQLLILPTLNCSFRLPCVMVCL